MAVVRLDPWGPRPSSGDGKARAEASAAARDRAFVCESCGAVLNYKPGSGSLVCTHCGHANQIADRAGDIIVEHDLDAALREGAEGAESEDVQNLSCGNCGAAFTLDPARHAGACPFCGSPAVTDTGTSRHIKPHAVLPFLVGEAEAQERVAAWLGSLWFAPGKLKRYARGSSKLAGIYLPYWTYDAASTADYRGQRGTAYHVPESFTANVNGRRLTQTRMVTKIRWQPAAGRVQRQFDDVLVLASHSLPRDLTDTLEPWDLTALKPYNPDYLSGFQSESYQVPLDDGFREAQVIMQSVLQNDVRRDIGGDMQQIASMAVRHDNRTFKHVLLPVWMAAYMFTGKSYRFVVNARTGQVQGQRPYSAWKIAGAVILALVVAAALAFVVSETQHVNYY